MAEHLFTPDQIVEGIGRAIRDRELEMVPSLIKLLAVQDPRRAQDILDTIDLGLTIRNTEDGQGQ